MLVITRPGIPFSWVQPTHDPSTSACHICGCPDESDDVVMRQVRSLRKSPTLSKWISFFEVDAPKTYQLWMFYTKWPKWPKWPIYFSCLCGPDVRSQSASAWRRCEILPVSRVSNLRKCCGACHHPTSSASKLQFEGSKNPVVNGGSDLELWVYILLAMKWGAHGELPGVSQPHTSLWDHILGCLALISSKFFTSYLPEIAVCCSKWALSLFDIVWLKAIFNICI